MANTQVSLARHDAEVLEQIADTVSWLSTAIVYHANRVHSNPSVLKAGGQA